MRILLRHRLQRGFPLTLLAAWTTLVGPSAQAISPYEPHYRSDVFSQRWMPQGVIAWPPNDGFAARPKMVVLQPGMLIDQFSTPDGPFFYAAGTPYRRRSLPYVCAELFYRMYRVLLPTPVLAGRVLPWFDEPGGGEQFKAEVSANQLIRDNRIEVVATIFDGSKSPSRPCD